MVCSVSKISRRSWLANLTGQFKDVFYRLGIETPDRAVAGDVPHSTPILTDGALNLGESTLDVTVTGIAIFVCVFAKKRPQFVGIESLDRLIRLGSLRNGHIVGHPPHLVPL